MKFVFLLVVFYLLLNWNLSCTMRELFYFFFKSVQKDSIYPTHFSSNMNDLSGKSFFFFFFGKNKRYLFKERLVFGLILMLSGSVNET